MTINHAWQYHDMDIYIYIHVYDDGIHIYIIWYTVYHPSNKSTEKKLLVQISCFNKLSQSQRLTKQWRFCPHQQCRKTTSATHVSSKRSKVVLVILLRKAGRKGFVCTFYVSLQSQHLGFLKWSLSTKWSWRLFTCFALPDPCRYSHKKNLSGSPDVHQKPGQTFQLHLLRPLFLRPELDHLRWKKTWFLFHPIVSPQKYCSRSWFLVTKPHLMISFTWQLRIFQALPIPSFW